MSGYRAPRYRDEYPELWDEAWLRHRYLTLKMGQTEIAEELGFDLPASAVDSALNRFGIPRRENGEAIRLAKQRKAKRW